MLLSDLLDQAIKDSPQKEALLQQHSQLDPNGWVKYLSPAFIQCAKIAEERGTQYNSARVPREAHFPFGMTSYAQMIHVKTMRLVSSIENGSDPADTLLDLINYASFAYESLDKK